MRRFDSFRTSALGVEVRSSPFGVRVLASSDSVTAPGPGETCESLLGVAGEPIAWAFFSARSSSCLVVATKSLWRRMLLLKNVSTLVFCDMKAT